MGVHAAASTAQEEGLHGHDGPVVGQQLQNLSRVKVSSVGVEQTEGWLDQHLLGGPAATTTITKTTTTALSITLTQVSPSLMLTEVITIRHIPLAPVVRLQVDSEQCLVEILAVDSAQAFRVPLTVVLSHGVVLQLVRQ